MIIILPFIPAPAPRNLPPGRLLSLPLLLEGYAPDPARLPDFVMALAKDVEWDEPAGRARTLARVSWCWAGEWLGRGRTSGCDAVAGGGAVLEYLGVRSFWTRDHWSKML